jgi:large subunit ribosomal protein L3
MSISGLIGRKLGMTSIFDESGKQIPCTIIEAGPCVITQLKTVEKDGYSAIQLGFEDKSQKASNNAEKNHFQKAETAPKRKLVEFKSLNSAHKLGETLSLEDVLELGIFVHVSSISKGKGFQGVVKRHGFAGVGQKTHGQHNRLRAPGSIGAASYPARVFKGMKMAGRMGGKRVTVQNLKVMQIIADKNLLVVKGAVSGHNNTFVTIQK